MIRFAFDAITSFSHAPLQAATVFGFLDLRRRLPRDPDRDRVQGIRRLGPRRDHGADRWCCCSAVQLITIGVIGEYLGSVYDEVKGRPLYIVDDAINVRAPGDARESAPDRDRIPAA